MAGVAALEPYIGKEDPNTLFELIEELAEGSFGTVYKVFSFVCNCNSYVWGGGGGRRYHKVK
jgi:hypothetical protein